MKHLLEEIQQVCPTLEVESHDNGEYGAIVSIVNEDHMMYFHKGMNVIYYDTMQARFMWPFPTTLAMFKSDWKRAGFGEI